MEGESKAMEVLKRGPVPRVRDQEQIVNGGGEPEQELAVPADQLTFLAFEDLVSKGELLRLDDSAEGLDGENYPVYREATNEEREDFLQALCSALIDDLEREGKLVKTGEFRPNRDGNLEPVYVHKAFADPSRMTPGAQDELADHSSA